MDAKIQAELTQRLEAMGWQVDDVGEDYIIAISGDYPGLCAEVDHLDEKMGIGYQEDPEEDDPEPVWAVEYVAEEWFTPEAASSAVMEFGVEVLL